MIELKELIIHSKRASKEGVNLVFENGINSIEYSKRYIYDFLKLKDQNADSGQFIVNGIEFFPINEERNESLNVFAIKSQVFCLVACFVVKNDEKKSFVNDVSTSLNQLKDMPLENDEQKKEKIQSILSNISKFDIGYVLYNKNNPINSENASLINEVVDQYKDQITFVVLEKEFVEEESAIDDKPVSLEDMPYNDMNTDSYVTEKNKNTNVVTNKKKTPSLFLLFFKKDWILYALIGLEICLSTFLGLLIPYFFSSNNSVWAIIMVILFVACLFIELFFISYSTPFFDKPHPDNEAKYLVVRAWEFIFALLGIGLAFGLFYLFKENNIAIKKEEWSSPLIIMGIVTAFINVVIPFFSKYIRKFFKLFKNNKHDE